MTDVGFKAVARQLCVGHAHSWPIRYLDVTENQVIPIPTETMHGNLLVAPGIKLEGLKMGD